MKSPNSLFSTTGTTVFDVMSRLAAEHKAVNLGQGFPDSNGPDDVRAHAAEALHDRPNQYPPMMGVPELRQAVAAVAERFYGLAVDWREEVMVASGGTEALAASFFGLINPGDEVVLIEPLYDSYLPIVRLAGGIPKLVRMTPPAWELPRDALAAAFSAKTKALVINTPMNPTGKVFTADELAFIADLLNRHDAYAICDEVYEHLTYGAHKHVPLMALPGMRARCLRVGSAGKAFGLTGWKVGYVTGVPALLQPCAKAHQYLTFTTPPNLQRAVAFGLGKDARYFETLAGDLERKRDFLADGLRRIGFSVLETHGTYFLNADFSGLYTAGDDVAFCRHLTADAGVTGIPLSAFYQGAGPSRYIRFAFCKEMATLTEALHRLQRHFGKG